LLRVIAATLAARARVGERADQPGPGQKKKDGETT